METGEIKTATIKACVSCSGGILEHDSFCRWCGAPQSAIVASGRSTHQRMAGSSNQLRRYETTRLVETEELRRVSGPLVNALVNKLASGHVSHDRPTLAARAVAALLSLPLWLMILLLSPFDAYAAARNLSRGL